MRLFQIFSFRLAGLLVPLVLVFLVVHGQAAGATDLHQLFEARCGRCHGHSGEFARTNLIWTGTEVRGLKTGEDVRSFLTRHYGRLSSEQIGLLAVTFRLQIETGGIFQKKCRICHDPAKDLVRLHLFVEDNKLVGRYTGRDIKAFLTRHGLTDQREADLLYRVFMWQFGIVVSAEELRSE